MSQALHKKAYAKINLGLDVIKRRPDGYHEVRMIMQMVDLYDELTISGRTDGQIRITTDCGELADDKHNLIYKAITNYREATGETMGADVSLIKKIPIAAGMAGGSTDAAAALVLYNRLCGRMLSAGALCEIGVKTGADVPYCIMGGTVLAEGIGERLTPLVSPPECTLVIAKPDISVSTKFVYENLRLDAQSVHPDIDGMKQAVESGELDGICRRMGNILESVTIAAYPVIAEIKRSLMDNGAENALMSGSGPTVFAIFKKKEKALEAKERLAAENLAGQIFVTGFHQGE